MPKTSSTSLMETMGRLHNLPYIQDNDHVRHLPISTEFRFIHRYHGCMREMTKDFFDKWTEDDIVHKNHILPTINNLNLLKDKKKVVLLRSDIDQAVLAYKRAQQKKIHAPRREFRVCKTDDDWLSRAIEVGMYGDLENFRDRWEEDDGERFLLYYEEVVSDPKFWINEVEKYFGLSVSDSVVYAKRRWSRGSRCKRRPS